MKTCNVIISAYKAPIWILECLEGFDRQESLPGWQWNILVGVDGCESTSESLCKADREHFYSKTNQGTYIVCNSLLKSSQADMYVRFDADDYPMRNFMRVGIKIAERDGLFRPYHKHCSITRKVIAHSTPKISHGVHFIRHDVMEQLGGYKHFRVSCDTDLLNRAKLLGYNSVTDTEPLFWRRQNPTSLTKDPKTDMKSEYRATIKKIMAKDVEAGITKCDPVTVPLERRPK